MKKRILLLSLFTIFICFTSSLTLVSCSKQNEYSQFDSFGEENRWQKSDTKTFEFDIANESQSYDMTFRFSHVFDYQFASVPINFSIENPKGEKENFSIDLAIKGIDGKELAECAGDVCDLNYKIKEKAKLIKGKYKVTVSHSFNGPYLPNVIGIGLKVESVK
ncbi:MAG TPA: hypothetical protein PKN96_06260 [Flavobacterium sp.]|uniref:hypothetical protein n=1 Tax=Flavobacterium sp. TaxID=239 RepID=UPI002BAB7583|nr:hypothetical protein [Flavobacterium sp.]HNP32876.1 hypothetical protein [Flavobacterium sp.]